MLPPDMLNMVPDLMQSHLGLQWKIAHVQHNTTLSYDSGFHSDTTHGLRRCSENDGCWKLGRVVFKMYLTRNPISTARLDDKTETKMQM